MGILRIPGQLYDSLYSSYGWFGVAFAALFCVLVIVGIMTWIDRRR